jgi:hypothetical protein
MRPLSDQTNPGGRVGPATEGGRVFGGHSGRDPVGKTARIASLYTKTAPIVLFLLPHAVLVNRALRVDRQKTHVPGRRGGPKTRPELDIVLEFAEGMCYRHFSVSGTE